MQLVVFTRDQILYNKLLSNYLFMKICESIKLTFFFITDSFLCTSSSDSVHNTEQLLGVTSSFCNYVPI